MLKCNKIKKICLILISMLLSIVSYTPIAGRNKMNIQLRNVKKYIEKRLKENKQ